MVHEAQRRHLQLLEQYLPRGKGGEDGRRNEQKSVTEEKERGEGDKDTGRGKKSSGRRGRGKRRGRGRRRRRRRRGWRIGEKIEQVKEEKKKIEKGKKWRGKG